MCTATRTFKIQKVETSNTVLLVPPGEVLSFILKIELIYALLHIRVWCRKKGAARAVFIGLTVCIVTVGVLTISGVVVVAKCRGKPKVAAPPSF